MPVSDVDRAKKFYLETLEVSEHEWGRVATLRDPEGNGIQLYEPLKN